jgi:hypothetical protein
VHVCDVHACVYMYSKQCATAMSNSSSSKHDVVIAEIRTLAAIIRETHIKLFHAVTAGLLSSIKTTPATIDELKKLR